MARTDIDLVVTEYGITDLREASTEYRAACRTTNRNSRNAIQRRAGEMKLGSAPSLVISFETYFRAHRALAMSDFATRVHS